MRACDDGYPSCRVAEAGGGWCGKVCDAFSGAMMTYTVYENPADFPGRFVVRRWMITRHSADPIAVKEPHAVCLTLETARQSIPAGLYRLPRENSDDACIVETWI